MSLHIVIFTLKFQGGSLCYSCLTDLFKTGALNSAKHPSYKGAFQSVTSYCSWSRLQFWKVNPISL